MNFIEKIDLSLLYWINKDLRTDIGDQFFPWITDLQKTSFFIYLLLPILISAILFWKKKEGLQFIFFLFITLLLNDFIGGNLIKPFFERLRPGPQGLDVILRVHEASGYSFISNHSSNSFCVAFFCFFYLPFSGYVLLPLALIIAFSRVYVGVHFPSDVLGGMFFGFLTSYFMSKLFRLWINKKNRQVSNG